ncbi:unnamed protein product [Nippostrongylus brasiliensis]|uniref:Amiloride-sensitive sodium channel n=1 Tax=Nippostrongylus brasiliensis TaxID=27835 RepID=A0A0N4XVY3_NIPBR|nr:hypothetical protein Q1695_010105 [Nippostrongylus brasiliensis]VDL70585.1 unnamed protein product [Nippostrongylus brasiliensis]
MAIKTACNVIIMLFLIGVCVVLFVLQSIYFINRSTGNSQKELTDTVDGEPLSMPALVICNRMPFSQDGVNSVNSALRQEQAMRYLLEWTNPSLREDADYVAMSRTYMDQGQTTVFQYIPQNIRNQSINQMQYMCQSMVNSCSYQGVVIQAYDCCRSILYKVPTTKGLCWAFYDRSLMQNSTSSAKQFTMTFQMSRNSWYSERTVPVHPGIDIYLRENLDDVASLSNQLETPIRLLNKKGVRLRMRKEVRADVRRSHCGQTVGSAESVDRNALEKNETNLLMCTIMVSMSYCNCHPLIAEMMPYDSNRFRDFSLRVNTTQVCTVDQYEMCARRYIDLTRPSAWREPIPRDMPGVADIERCRSENPYPCTVALYPGTLDQYDLPSDYQTTQDFVARLVLEYSTTRTTEVLITSDPTLYELLSYIGYNLATWFCIGHIIWSLYALIRDHICCCCSNKVTPVSPRRAFSISHPVETQSEAKDSAEDGESAS